MAVLRNPWTRLAWIEEMGTARLFACGEEFQCSLASAAALCESPGAVSLDNFQHPEDSEVLLSLINQGYFYVGYVD
jgi:hypothetical protein